MQFGRTFSHQENKINPSPLNPHQIQTESKNGYLYKLEKSVFGNKVWKKRFFKLSGFYLTVTTNEKKTNPLNNMDMRNCVGIVESSFDKGAETKLHKPMVIELLMKEPTEASWLLLGNEDEIKSWKETLNKAIQNLRPKKKEETKEEEETQKKSEQTNTLNIPISIITGSDLSQNNNQSPSSLPTEFDKSDLSDLSEKNQSPSKTPLTAPEINFKVSEMNDEIKNITDNLNAIKEALEKSTDLTETETKNVENLNLNVKESTQKIENQLQQIERTISQIPVVVEKIEACFTTQGEIIKLIRHVEELTDKPKTQEIHIDGPKPLSEFDKQTKLVEFLVILMSILMFLTIIS